MTWVLGDFWSVPRGVSPLPSIFPSIRVFSNESVIHIRWPKYWSFSFSLSPSNEHPGLEALLLPSIFPSIRVFSNESALHIRWPKYWSFSFNISPYNEHTELIPLGWTGWISLQSKGLSTPTPQFKSINSSALSFLYSPTLTSIPDHWKSHNFY